MPLALPRDLLGSFSFHGVAPFVDLYEDGVTSWIELAISREIERSFPEFRGALEFGHFGNILKT